MIDVIEKIIAEIDANEKEYFLYHQHRFKYIFSLLQQHDNGESLLDIGSHYEHVLLGAHFLGYKNIFGIDLSVFNAVAIDRAKKINAVIKDCDLGQEGIPFADQSFNIVLLTETLEHFNFHPKKVFAEISRVLKPGGELVITTPNLLRLNNRLKFILGKSINYDIKEDYTPGTHFREYSAVEIAYLLNIAGLKKVRLQYIDFHYPSGSQIGNMINKVFGYLCPSLGKNIIMIGKKEGLL
ncbi:MAG: class I SAM-dependent methyltransferase [Patescibacteria group bacterium]